MKQEDHNNDGRQYHDAALAELYTELAMLPPAEEARYREQRVHKMGLCQCLLKGNCAKHCLLMWSTSAKRLIHKP